MYADDILAIVQHTNMTKRSEDNVLVISSINDQMKERRLNLNLSKTKLISVVKKAQSHEPNFDAEQDEADLAIMGLKS